ncbi:CRAL-TRIO domain-containing protein [Vanrija pseudolonga]|uniref:CRAL-TRIO domain-containing protein n=1 Tax=Vanrija pseudolonga TaxID=143232 RepID=A0AAF1BEV7_9TREE|nr:CRAL-TRIO domain-containing protein [Vanrija pseudolonga]
MSSFFSRSSKKSSKSAASSAAPSVASSAAAPSIAPSAASTAAASDAGASVRTIGPPTSSIIAVAPASSVIPERNYTEEELGKITQLREYTSTLQLPPSDAYAPWEARFLADPAVHARYMRAAKWHVEDAKKRIKATVEWRREFQPDLIEPGEIEVEQETGKLVISGFDRNGRPLMYMRPGRQNTKETPRQLRYTVYFLERCIDLMPAGQESVTLVIDYASISFSQRTSPRMAMDVLHVLQNHYVERLGRALLVNVPWFFSAFFTAVSPFIDPVSRDKIRFNPAILELIEPDQLESDYGGTVNFVYEHGVYWKELSDFCRIAPDGKRLDPTGKPWVPPTGLGIKHAVDEFVADEEATLAEGGVDEADVATPKAVAAALPSIEGVVGVAA